jgi:methionyl-tRNA formyltransferase
MSDKVAILLAINNTNGLISFRYLLQCDTIIIKALLVHPEKNAQRLREIKEIAENKGISVITWEKKSQDKIVQAIKEQDTDILLSVNFGYLIPERVLVLFENALNLHTGYLPWNKGKHPNVWPLIDGSPAGVTLHIMTPKIDQGPIVYREKVPVEPDDNAKTLYHKLERTSIKVLEKALIPYLQRKITPFTPLEEGTHHTHSDFLELLHIRMDQRQTAREWINLLRALTFPPYQNAWFLEEGKKYFLSIGIQLEKEE